MPNPRQQPEGATSPQVFLPTTPTDDWSRRSTPASYLTNKALNPIRHLLPVFKVARTTTTEVYFAKASQCRQPKCSPELTRVVSESTSKSHIVSEFQDLIASIPCVEPIALCSLLRLLRGTLLRCCYGAVQVQPSSRRTRFWKPCHSRLRRRFKERRPGLENHSCLFCGGR